jgi:nitroreductase
VEFSDVVRRRRMVRRYAKDPVDPEVLDRVVAAGLRGPSAGFSQGVRLVVVTDTGRRRQIAQLCDEDAYVDAGFQPWLSVVPVHIVVTVREQDYRERYAEPDKASAGGVERWSAPYWWVDGGAALMLLLLAAVDEGLGAGVLDIADVAGLRALLGIPDDIAPVCLVTIGHPAQDRGPVGSAARGRRKSEDVVHYERW